MSTQTLCPVNTGFMPCCRGPSALPPQAFGLTSGKGGLVRLDCWTANSSFWTGQLPFPTSSDRRRPSASQHRCPRRARWSFPSYSPESLSLHSTIGSRNRRQISFSVPAEGCFVVRLADFSDIVFFEPVPGLVLGRGPGTKSFKEVSDYRGFIFLSPCPV